MQKIDFNYPTSIGISQDCKTIAIALDTEHSVKVYNVAGLGKYDDDDAKIKIDLAGDFGKGLHKTTIHSLFLDRFGKFVVTSSEEADTTIKGWSISGVSLNTYNNNQLKNYKMIASDDGKFVGVVAWANDCRLFEVKTNKDGSLKTIAKAMELKGHKQSLISLGINYDNEKAATISKDNTIKIWNLKVSYEIGEDAKCLKTIDIKKNKALKDKQFNTIAIYHNPDPGAPVSLIALTYECNMIIYDYDKQTVVEEILQAHNEGFTINKLLFRVIKEKLYLFSGGEDGRINMWKIQ